MKSVLVILTQANLANLQVHESLSATMVLATFGCEVKVLLQDMLRDLQVLSFLFQVRIRSLQQIEQGVHFVQQAG